jgi:hypothetical protein
MNEELKYHIDQLIKREDQELKLKLVSFKFMLDGQIGLLKLKLKKQ